MVGSYAPLGSKKNKKKYPSLVVAYPIGREISKSRHLSLQMTPKDIIFSKFLFSHFVHFYLPEVFIVEFSLKYAKFGHKMTLKSPLFYFFFVFVTSWNSKGGDFLGHFVNKFGRFKRFFFSHCFHLYLSNGDDRFFSPKSAKFGHKMTQKVTLFWVSGSYKNKKK